MHWWHRDASTSGASPNVIIGSLITSVRALASTRAITISQLSQNQSDSSGKGQENIDGVPCGEHGILENLLKFLYVFFFGQVVALRSDIEPS